MARNRSLPLRRFGPLTLLLVIASFSFNPTTNARADENSATVLRVVVTEIGPDGKSRFASDGEPGFSVRTNETSFMGDLWNIAGIPATTQSGTPPAAYQLEPERVGGTKFRVASIPPIDSTQPAHEKPTDAARENSEHGMHQTNTIDFVTIISGEVWLQLDDGAETLLKAGDTVVQRGTNHAWINRSNQPCVFSAVMVKAAE